MTTTYNCHGCYGGEYLLQRYLYDRFGGDTYLHAMENSAATSYANLATATGQTGATLPLVFGDFAIAMAASNTGVSTDPRFNFGGLNLHHFYTSAFNNTRALNGAYVAAQIFANGSGSATGFLGGYVYLSGSSLLANQVVNMTDATGTFKLTAGVVQR